MSAENLGFTKAIEKICLIGRALELTRLNRSRLPLLDRKLTVAPPESILFLFQAMEGTPMLSSRQILLWRTSNRQILLRHISNTSNQITITSNQDSSNNNNSSTSRRLSRTRSRLPRSTGPHSSSRRSSINSFTGTSTTFRREFRFKRPLRLTRLFKGRRRHCHIR